LRIRPQVELASSCRAPAARFVVFLACIFDWYLLYVPRGTPEAIMFHVERL
jgi:hypothetical protein